jgi:DNA-binding MarR family transcriptional regulator
VNEEVAVVKNGSGARELAETSVAIDEIDEAIVAFHHAYQAVIAEADELLAERGLARSHHKILYYAVRHAGCSVTDVRNFIGVSRQAMQRPLNDLHQRGLIELFVAPGNRRLHRVVLTREGADLERRVSGVMRHRFETAFSKVSKTARQNWFALMRAFERTDAE